MTSEEFYKKTYEGWKFTVKDSALVPQKYIFGTINDRRVYVGWYEHTTLHNVLYFLSDVLSNIDDGTWILEKKFNRRKKMMKICSVN